MTRSEHPHLQRLVAKAKTLQSWLVFLPTVAGRAVRDFIDVCALVRTAGLEAALSAMESFDALYGGVSTAGPLLAFAAAAHDQPVDLDDFDPVSWRSLAPAYRDFERVLAEVRRFAISAVEAAAARRRGG